MLDGTIVRRSARAPGRPARTRAARRRSYPREDRSRRHSVSAGCTAGRASEDLVGEAISRATATKSSWCKVILERLTRAGTIAACTSALKRLRTDRIDLYLLHWRGEHPLAETVTAFEALKKASKIRRWGVSISTMTTWTSCSPPRAAAPAPPIRCSTISPARHRMGPVALGALDQSADHGYSPLEQAG